MAERRYDRGTTDVSARRAGQDGKGSRPEAQLLGGRAEVRRGHRDATNRQSARPEARSGAFLFFDVRCELPFGSRDASMFRSYLYRNLLVLVGVVRLAADGDANA